MRTVNMHQAKTHLSRLVREAVNGEPFVIARAGKPLVRVTALDEAPRKRLIGCLDGQFSVPDDFDTMFAEGRTSTPSCNGLSPSATPKPKRNSSSARASCPAAGSRRPKVEISSRERERP